MINFINCHFCAKTGENIGLIILFSNVEIIGDFTKRSVGGIIELTDN